MSHRRDSDWDKSEPGVYYQNAGDIAARTGQSLERQHYNYDNRRTCKETHIYEYDPRTGRDMSSASAAQDDPTFLRSCFAAHLHRRDERHRDQPSSDRPRQRYAESFQPHRRSPSPPRLDSQSYLDHGYGDDDDYRHSSSHYKPPRRSGSRHHIAFEKHGADANRYVYRYSPQHSDNGYGGPSGGRRSPERESYDRCYDGKDEYRQRRR